MLAYHNDPAIKAAILKQLAAHAAADEIIKRQYWEGGKGCAVGCTIHSDDHMEYESRFGIPVMLASLEDTIFEGLPDARAKDWPHQFMSAIEVGADLSLVGWKFQYWLLTDPKVNPGIEHETVREAVKLCADALYPLTKGLPVDVKAARSAKKAFKNVARSGAAIAARSALFAAIEARSGEESALLIAESARVVALLSTKSAAYVMMSDKLLDLIKEAGDG